MKPPLTLVPTPGNGRTPRRKPRQTGTDLVKTISEGFELEAGGIALLNETAMLVDRLNSVADQISKDGPMLKWGKGSSRPHPLLKTELALHTLIGRNLQRLGVGLEPVQGIGRPTRGFGVGWDDDEDDSAD